MSRRRVATLIVLATAAAVLTGCGADDPPLSAEAASGRDIAHRAGCASCHGADFAGGSGPSWQGIYGEAVTLDDGTTVIVGDDYLHDSIVDPGSQVVDGFPPTMPSFRGQLSDDEIDAVIAYIAALGPTPTSTPGPEW